MNTSSESLRGSFELRKMRHGPRGISSDGRQAQSTYTPQLRENKIKPTLIQMITTLIGRVWWHTDVNTKIRGDRLVVFVDHCMRAEDGGQNSQMKSREVMVWAGSHFRRSVHIPVIPFTTFKRPK